MGWPEAIFGSILVISFAYVFIKLAEIERESPPEIQHIKPEPLWKITTTTYPSVSDKKEEKGEA